MLYRCYCKSFSILENNYREITLNKIFISLLNEIKNIKIKNIALIFLEPGGLKDEYLLLKKLIPYFDNFFIGLIEPNINKEIFNSKNFFYKYLKKIIKNKNKKIDLNIEYSDNIFNLIDKIPKNYFLVIIGIDQLKNIYIPNLNTSNLNLYIPDYFQQQLQSEFQFLFQFYLYNKIYQNLLKQVLQCIYLRDGEFLQESYFL